MRQNALEFENSVEELGGTATPVLCAQPNALFKTESPSAIASRPLKFYLSGNMPWLYLFLLLLAWLFVL
jgi:hypothetical protein